MTLIRNCRPVFALVLAILFGLPLVGITAQDTSLSPDKAEDITRWKPRYKPGKRIALSQRERRTGYIDTRAEFEEEIPEPVAKAPETSRGDKRGFFPFKKAATETPEKQGVWPFGKKKEAGAAAADQAKGGAVTTGETKEGATTDAAGEGEAAADAVAAGEKGAEEAEKAKKAPKPPKEPSTAELIGKLRRKDAELPRGTPEAYVAGKEAFEKANYNKAIGCFEDFIEGNDVPDSPLIAPARYFIAKSFQNSGQEDVAVSLYQQIQQEHTKNRFWCGLAGIELVAMGKEALVLPAEEEKTPETTTPKVETTTPPTGTEPPVAAPAGAPNEAPSMAPGRLPGE